MNAAIRRLDSTAWGLLLLLSVLWGGSFLYVKLALAELPPVTIITLRIVFGGLALLAILRLRGVRMPRDFKVWRGFLVLAIANAIVPFTLIAWGQREISAGLAAIINSATPLWTMLLAHFFTADERLNGSRAAGIVIGFAGVVLLVGPDALEGLGAAVLAQLACVAATVSYGVALVWGRRFRGVDGGAVAAGQFLTAAPIAIVLSAVIDRPWTLAMPGPLTIAAIVGLVLLSTAAAYIVYFRLMQTYGAGNASLVTMLIPPSAMLLGAAFLGEAIEARSLGGFALLAAGLAVVDGRILRAIRR
ncbi:MAG: EamA family transporter [Alphaproteobacteria bacterium]|nr:EamA family transporter [Alphaproteobacteria bacterium]